jgi:hypothetical protein
MNSGSLDSAFIMRVTLPFQNVKHVLEEITLVGSKITMCINVSKMVICVKKQNKLYPTVGQIPVTLINNYSLFNNPCLWQKDI